MAYSERDRNLETQLRSLELPVVTRTDKKEPKGTGSYANVYEVMVHETVCAAKEMHPILISETKKSAFLAECVQCSRILHPNVVQFLGIYYPSPDAQLPWLVMEMMYISLTGLIEKYETEDFPFHVKLSILVDACQGIQYLHSRDIIHRDLSSNNILLTMYLVAKIGDLGMAKVVSRDLDKHTQAPGTVAFMPPEALSVNPVYGPSIDVFSLGCVCVHMVSLQWPIPSDQVTADDVVVSEIQRREAYLINLTKFPGLTQLVERCLQNKSEKRPAIGDVIKDLKNVEYDRHPHKYDSIIELFKGVKNLENVLNQKDQQLMAKDNQLILKDQQLSQKNEQIYQKDQQLKQKDEELALIVSQKDQKLQQKGQEMVQIVSLKDQKLDQKDEQLRQKDQEISAKDVQISKKKQQLRHKEQEMAEILNQKEQILNQKDQQISEKDKQLKENDQQLMRMEQEIAQKDEQLSQKDQQLRQQDQEMAQMVSQMDQKLHQKDQLQQEMTHDQQLCLQLTQKNQKLAQDVSNQADQILDSKDQLRGRSQKMARNELELESSRKTQESLQAEIDRLKKQQQLTAVEHKLVNSSQYKTLQDQLIAVSHEKETISRHLEKLESEYEDMHILYSLQRQLGPDGHKQYQEKFDHFQKKLDTADSRLAEMKSHLNVSIKERNMAIQERNQFAQDLLTEQERNEKLDRIVRVLRRRLQTMIH